MQYRNRLTSHLLAAVLIGGTSLAAVAGDTPDTVVHADNDGIALNMAADSTHPILAVRVRIVGPDGFIVEKRAESDVLEWIPESELPDGTYSWEAWVVTAHPDAEVIEPLAERNTQEVAATRANLEAHGEPVERELVPVERYFRSEDKHVESQSGRFRVEHGMLHEIDDNPETFGDPISSTPSSNILTRLASATLNLLVPSAHAEEVFNENVRVQSSQAKLSLESTSSGEGEWNFWVGGSTGDLYLPDRDSLQPVLRIEQGSASNSLYIRSSSSTHPRIGMGTTTPSDTFHMSSGRPQIRMEDTSEDQSWYMRNTNEGRFEISHTRTGAGLPDSERPNPFTIEPGAMDGSLYIKRITNCFTDPLGNTFCLPGNRVGISTTEPTADLHIVPTGVSAGRIKIGSDDAANTTITGAGTGFDVSVSQVSGSQLRIDSDTGNVGIGTTSPSSSLEVEGSDALLRVRNTDSNEAARDLYQLFNNGRVRFKMFSGAETWEFTGGEGDFRINSLANTQAVPMIVHTNGDAEFAGDVYADGVKLTSTREAKTDFESLDEQDILQKLSSLEIMTWRYKNDPDGARRIGPVAEDFRDIFGLSDGTTLNMIDTNGVTFAAIKALKDENERLANQNEMLLDRLDRIESAINL